MAAQKINNNSDKINAWGFINYDSSIYDFQEGGKGKGDGQAYINQWIPEFHPSKKVDNVKISTGDTSYGTQNILNTKEVEINYSPAQAVEDDVFDFYQRSGSCWTWGSVYPPFSALTVPFEYLTFDCSTVSPSGITAMTLSQYIEHVYTNAIDPTTRKTNSQTHNSWYYPELKNIYLNYYYSTLPTGNTLTIGKLEAYINLLEVHLGEYIEQLLPATTIFGGGETIYKNPVFHRQRHVYKEGIDAGSTFKRYLPPDLNPIIYPVSVSMTFVPTKTAVINTINLNALIPNININQLNAISLRVKPDENNISANIDAVTTGLGSDSLQMSIQSLINQSMI